MKTLWKKYMTRRELQRLQKNIYENKRLNKVKKKTSGELIVVFILLAFFTVSMTILFCSLINEVETQVIRIEKRLTDLEEQNTQILKRIEWKYGLK